MPKYISVLLTFLVTSLALGHDVTIDTVPSPTYAIKQTVTGSLTDAATALTNPVGRCTITFNVSLTASTPTGISCCNGLLPGRKADIADSSVKVKVVFGINKIELPDWTNRTSTCTSATDEWNKAYNSLKTHEIGHDTVNKDFFKESNLKPAYFDSADFSTTSSCMGLLQQSSANDDARNKVKAKLATIKSSMETARNAAQDAYHGQVGTCPFLIDTTKDCQ